MRKQCRVELRDSAVYNEWKFWMSKRHERGRAKLLAQLSQKAEC